MKNIITNENTIHILIAIAIFCLFYLLSPIITYIILKVFNWKKNRKDIKKIALYGSIKKFILLLGLYIGIINIKIPESSMIYITKSFKIITILIFTFGFANSISVKSVFLKRLQDRMSGESTDGMLKVIVKAIRFLIYIIGVFLVITELGYNLNGLVTGLGLGTVVLTLAAQDTAKNLFSGLTIVLDKPFVVGDWIRVAGYEGSVESVTFKSTRIRTRENTIVNIPNTIISSDTLVNETKRKNRWYSTNLIFTFDTPLNKLKEVSEKIDFMLKHNEHVLTETVNVKFTNIADNGYKIYVYCFTNTVEYLEFLEKEEYINYEIMKIINKEGVKLAYPSTTVFVKNENGDE